MHPRQVNSLIGQAVALGASNVGLGGELHASRLLALLDGQAVGEFGLMRVIQLVVLIVVAVTGPLGDQRIACNCSWDSYFDDGDVGEGFQFCFVAVHFRRMRGSRVRRVVGWALRKVPGPGFIGGGIYEQQPNSKFNACP